MENISFGFLLMGVGLATVFAVLLLVIYTGKLLIITVNRFFPEAEVVKKVVAAATGVQDISQKQLSVIAAAVNVISGGKAHITHVEKIK